MYSSTQIETNVKEPRQKKRVINQKSFDLRLTRLMENNLRYFISQELAYYNAVVEQFTSRVKAFPEDIMSIQDKHIRLLETFAQYGIDPEKLIYQPFDKWPEQIKPFKNLILDSNNKCILPSKHIGIMSIGACAGHLPSSVRKNITSEAFRYVLNQADTLLSAKRTETLKSFLQMLQPQTLESKRHLQLGYNMLSISFNEKMNASLITTPYGKDPLVINDFDLTPVKFDLAIIRSPLKYKANQKWIFEIKDNGGRYLLNMTDHFSRNRK